MTRRRLYDLVWLALALGLFGMASGDPALGAEPSAPRSSATGAAVPRAGGELPKSITNSIGMELVLIPRGDFTMGTDAATLKIIDQMQPKWRFPALAQETPPHRVRISRPFYIGRYEVTNGEYRRFRPQHDSRHFLGRSLNQDRQPAALVSWRDATAFCQWLSQREGRQYTLPTEAEWEYSCRGGADTIYYWGDTFDPGRLNFADRNAHYLWSRFMGSDGHAVSAPVGSFPPNPFGLYDMLGNVWEWCADWYSTSYYHSAPRDAPSGPSQGILRVCRGGSWDVFPGDNRCAKRGQFFPEDRHFALGFRVVMRPDVPVARDP